MEQNKQKDRPQCEREKSTWQTPQMVCLGQLTELIQGGNGKTTGSWDSDPHGAQFPPGQS